MLELNIFLIGLYDYPLHGWIKNLTIFWLWGTVWQLPRLLMKSWRWQTRLWDAKALYTILNSKSINSWYRLWCIFICTVSKSHMEWSNAQHVSTPTTTTNHIGYLLWLELLQLQISMYQNIAKLLTHPSIITELYLVSRFEDADNSGSLNWSCMHSFQTNTLEKVMHSYIRPVMSKKAEKIKLFSLGGGQPV